MTLARGPATLILALALTACAGSHPACYKAIVATAEEGHILVAAPCPPDGQTGGAGQ
jgi:hypothetical protein